MMKTSIWQMLTSLVLNSLAGYFIQVKTRKPKSDLKSRTQTICRIDKRITVDAIEIIKIDTILHLFKIESLVGIMVKGQIHNTHNSSSLNYLKDLIFIETIDINQSKRQMIEIVPTLKTTNPKLGKFKLRKTKVKYNYFDDITEFEFYVERKIYTIGFGEYKIEISCGQKTETIRLFRRK